MSFVCPTNLRVVAPLDSSHRRSVLSQEDESAYAPSDDITYVKQRNQNVLTSCFAKSERDLSYTVGNYVRMAMKASFWIAILCVVAGQVPYDQGLVPTA